MTAYVGTPVDAVRTAIDGGEFKLTGDPDKMVDAMIAVAQDAHPPLRLTLGSTAYASILAALTERRDALIAQRDLTCSVNVKA